MSPIQMQISRNYRADDWTTLTFTSEADWQTAVDIFLDRLETRYLKHIREILRHRTSGFAALTLDCALIETLQQFRQGTQKTQSGRVEASFVSFLTGTSFSPHVTKEQARVFYKTIRCGLLHQTEAEASLVKRSSTLPLIAFTQDHKGVIVNAKAFHAQLQQAIQEYADMLRRPESTQERAAFRTKMDFICRIEAKQPKHALPQATK
jgi:hypothetical protein